MFTASAKLIAEVTYFGLVCLSFTSSIVECSHWLTETRGVSAAFVKSDRPARYPGLRVKYVRGADPVIKLMDEEERVQEVSDILLGRGGSGDGWEQG